MAAGLLGLVSIPASAATYYVSPGGSSANSGTSPSSPWSISRALSSAVAGDVVLIADGSYGGDLAPSNSGNSSARVSFVGNVNTPTNVIFSGNITLNGKQYVSVKGVQGNDINLNATSTTVRSEQDTIAYCRATGSLWCSGGLRSNVSHCTIGNIGGVHLWYLSRNPIPTTLCTFRDNIMYFGGVTAQPHAVRFDHPYMCEFTNNKVLVSMPPGAADVHGRIQYDIEYCTFKDNKWSLDNQTGYANYIFVQRDSSFRNTYVRDTCLELPSSNAPAIIDFATSGSYPGTCGHNTFIGCVFKANNTLAYQNDVVGDSWYGCQLISTGRAMDFNALQAHADSITFRHCTFFATGSVIIDASKCDHMKFVDNVTYSGSQNCPGVFMQTSASSDSNLYFQATGSSGGAVGNGSGICSPVGPGTSICSSSGNECNSKWGNPAFVNATYANFNGGLNSGSPAAGSFWKDGYVGAVPFGTVAPDVTPPQATNLVLTLVSDNVASLTWVAPGDDGMTGTASAYDLRYSTQPITDNTSFASATQVSNAPVPAPAGSPQAYIMTGLAAGTRYYFAIKARDEANNWSALGTPLTVQTASTDQVPPSSIGDLR